MHLTTTSSKKLLKLSYLISKIIALAGEAHTIAENLIKSCMLEDAEILLSKNDYLKSESIFLSSNTATPRIDDMGMYIKSEIPSRLQQVTFFSSNG